MWQYLETGSVKRWLNLNCGRPESHLTGILMSKGNLDRRKDNKVAHAQRRSHGRTQQEGGCLQAKERGLGRNQSCQQLDLGLLASRAIRKQIFAAYATQSVGCGNKWLRFSSLTRLESCSSESSSQPDLNLDLPSSLFEKHPPKPVY